MFCLNQLSEPGFAGLQDYQDKKRGLYTPFQKTNLYLFKRTLEGKTPNPENPEILKILVQK